MSTKLIVRCALMAAAAVAPLFAQCPPRRPPGPGPGPGPQPIPAPPVYRGPGDVTSTPSPQAPSPATPQPGTPHTPRAQPGFGRFAPPGNQPVGRGATTPRGAPVEYTHRQNSLERLKIDWIYPALEPIRPEGDTAARTRTVALPPAEMLATLAGEDPRPLLIVRECHRCQGSEAALLDTEKANEKTILLARWFRCIRFDDSVRHETHPCRLLFEEHGMPHLMLWSPLGDQVEPLDGTRSQGRLWSTMTKVLRQSYTKDPDTAVREMFKVLAAFDHLDSMEAEIGARMQNALDDVASTSPRVQALEAELAKVRAERDALQAREAALMDLGLRPRPADAPK